MLPEWLLTALILSIDVRRVFGTGKWGDWKSTDDQKSIADRWRAYKAGGKETANNDNENGEGSDVDRERGPATLRQ